MLSKEEIKSKLEEEKKEIEAKIKELKQIPEFGDDVDSLEEETNESEEYGNQLAEMQIHKNRLADIESALNKIGNGKYGICEKCGKEIAEEILAIDPESRYCRSCKIKGKTTK